jgi:hypothetical protein
MCINLRERFGDRYRISHEESYAAERTEYRAAEERWLQIIPCQHGHIGPWDSSRLVACTRKAGPVAQRLAALPRAEVVQDGADGANIAFPVEAFEQVAETMRPKRRRQWTPEDREAVRERLAKYAFRPVVNDAPEALDCVGTGSAGS